MGTNQQPLWSLLFTVDTGTAASPHHGLNTTRVCIRHTKYWRSPWWPCSPAGPRWARPAERGAGRTSAAGSAGWAPWPVGCPSGPPRCGPGPGWCGRGSCGRPWRGTGWHTTLTMRKVWEESRHTVKVFGLWFVMYSLCGCNSTGLAMFKACLKTHNKKVCDYPSDPALTCCNWFRNSATLPPSKGSEPKCDCNLKMTLI